jgi:hypothetical protein
MFLLALVTIAMTADNEVSLYSSHAYSFAILFLILLRSTRHYAFVQGTTFDCISFADTNIPDEA